MSNPYEPGNGSGSDPYGAGGQGGQNPYGGPSDPYAGGPSSPYGGGPSSPYGGGPTDPYGGGPSPFGPPSTPTRTDGVSIAGFVVSFLCVLAPIGVILSIVGLKRTSKGRRKGRWAAIAGLVVGLVVTVAVVIIAVAVVFVAKTIVTPGNATAGECVNVSHDTKDDTYSLTKKSCTDTHDAEIVYVGRISESSQLSSPPFDAKSVCSGLMPSTDAATVPSGYDWSVLTNNPDNPSPSDKFVCYVEPTSGTLDHPILDK